jgi:hypothetical protein
VRTEMMRRDDGETLIVARLDWDDLRLLQDGHATLSPSGLLGIIGPRIAPENIRRSVRAMGWLSAEEGLG